MMGRVTVGGRCCHRCSRARRQMPRIQMSQMMMMMMVRMMMVVVVGSGAGVQEDRFGLGGTVVVAVAVVVGTTGRVGTVTGDSVPVCGVPARSSGGDRGGEIGA
uniref:Uncharacterized protein n=1 Tax=Anopheles coluzzii TaxID=1518534 RepID=A0A8W7PTI7_ANOCL